MFAEKLTNAYGNIDLTRTKLPKTYAHVAGVRLAQLCEKHGINYRKAVIGFAGERKFGFRPIFGGVVVYARSQPKLLNAIAERKARANAPSAILAKQRQAAAKKEREEALRAELRERGIKPSGRLAEALKRGDIEIDLAELIAFKVGYRHRRTDYEEHFRDDDFQDLRERGFSPAEAGQQLRMQAREAAQEHPIPATWPGYLAKYQLKSKIAKALAATLAAPQQCHPKWFKEAEIAVRRAGIPLEGLTYEKIRDAIDSWRAGRRD